MQTGLLYLMRLVSKALQMSNTVAASDIYIYIYIYILKA